MGNGPVRGAQGVEGGVQPGFDAAQVLEGIERAVERDEGRLCRCDRLVRVGNERREEVGVGLKAFGVGEVGGDGCDGGSQALADRVQVGLGGRMASVSWRAMRSARSAVSREEAARAASVSTACSAASRAVRAESRRVVALSGLGWRDASVFSG